MTDTHVISALKEKRARLDGEIKMRRYQITRLEMELAHVDAVIGMFKPGYDVEKIATKRSFGKNPAGVPKGAALASCYGHGSFGTHRQNIPVAAYRPSVPPVNMPNTPMIASVSVASVVSMRLFLTAFWRK